jgi:multiple sugar transport system substrate-binding protein
MNNDGRQGGVSRRSFVKAAGASGITAGTVGLAGCLGGADEDAVIIHSDSDFQDIRDSIQETLWEAGLDEDISYEVRAAADETDQRRQDIQSALQGGRSPPDIFMMDSGWTIPFILREQTENLSELLSDDVVDRIENDYLDASVETARHPETDDLHALPLFPDFSVMLYREDLIEDAGYDTSDWGSEPLSWQEFSEVIADVQQQNDLSFGFTTQADAYEGLACCTFNEAMSSWGGAYFGGVENLFDAGDRPITVDEEPVLNAIRMMRAFMYGEEDEHALEGYEQIAPTSIVQWIEDPSLGPFLNGNAVAHRNWPFSVGEGADAFGEDLGVMPVPYGVPEEESEYEGLGGSRAALGGWHLTINPHSDRQEESVAIMEAFATDEVQLAMFEEQGWLPPNIDLLETPEFEEVEPFGQYAETLQLLGEGAVPRPVTDIWAEQAGLIAIEVHNSYTQQKSPEEAMEDLRERLERSERDVEDM